MPTDGPLPPTALLRRAKWFYDRAGQAERAALGAFQDHIARNPYDARRYQEHQRYAEAAAALTAGDSAYLDVLILPPGPDRRAAAAVAARHYDAALAGFQDLVLRYYLTDDLRARFGLQNAAALPTLSADQREAAFAAARQQAQRLGFRYVYDEQTTEMASYVDRARARLSNLADAGLIAPRD